MKKRLPSILLLLICLSLFGCDSSEKEPASLDAPPIQTLYWGISYEDALSALGLNESDVTVEPDESNSTQLVTLPEKRTIYGKQAQVKLNFILIEQQGYDGSTIPPLGLCGMDMVFEENIEPTLQDLFGGEGSPYMQDLYSQMGAKGQSWSVGQRPGEIEQPELLKKMKIYNNEGKSFQEGGPSDTWNSVKDKGCVDIALITAEKELGSRVIIYADQAAAMRVLAE